MKSHKKSRKKPIVAQVGYMLGNRNFRILGLFGIKPNLKDETR